MSTSTNWTGTNECPFCGDALASPGVGFVNHLEENPDCEAAFETWRDRISDDMAAGWSG